MMPVPTRSLWISLLLVLVVISLLSVANNRSTLIAYKPAVEEKKEVNIISKNGNETTQVGNVVHGNGTKRRSDITEVNETAVDNRTNSNVTASDSSVFSLTRNATIVVYLHGEMGNHLMMFAKAIAVKTLAAEEYGISTELVLRHQMASKWTRARDSIKECFPKLRHFNFSAANTHAFDKLAEEQAQQLQTRQIDPTRLEDGSMYSMDEMLSSWKSLLLESPHHNMNLTDGTVSFPYFTVKTHCPYSLVDRYLDQIRRFLEFDRKACCSLLPEPDESVFHLRNFLVEMPKRGKHLGFEELSPNKTAYELFAHLQPGDKVAITTRFGGEHVEPYVSAFIERGLNVRVIEGQSDTEDFCFLMSAQKELIGYSQSTFSRWAAFLGHMKHAELYFVISPSRVNKHYSPFQWNHPNLKDRVFTTAYKSEEQDSIETKER